MPFSRKKFELSSRLKSGVGRGYTQNQILKLAAIFCLVLAVGLGINAARLILKGGGSSSAGDTNQAVLGASDIKQQSSQNDIQFISYTVKPKDTVFNIAQQYNISWTTLATLNNLKSPFYLKPGQTLKVPKQ